MSYSDFDGEFASLKKSSLEEMKNDKFVQRLQSERKPRSHTVVEEGPSSEEESFYDTTETKTSDEHYTTKPRRKLQLRGIDELKKMKDVESKPRKRVHLTGINELRQNVEKKPRKRVKLIPLPKGYSIEPEAKDGEVKETVVEETVENDDQTRSESHEGAGKEGSNEKSGKNEEDELSNNYLNLNGDENTGDADQNGESHVLKDEDDGEVSSASDTDDTSLMKRIIMGQLTGRDFPSLDESSLAPTYKEIFKVLQHTVHDRESASALLIGPRGTGKTLAVNRALDDLHKRYGKSFITIKLNAFLHTDDNLAFREIARQLDVNSNSGSSEDNTRTFEQRAISDTVANVLMALDSNASPDRSEEDLKSSTPVVFIIDEIEEFTASKKQTLLYNLFELSQSSKIPIGVIGVGTKFTTRELLEKRVRSRFSQRIITTHLPSSIEQFWENAKLSLQVHVSAMDKFKDKQYPLQWNHKINDAFSQPTKLARTVYKIFFSTKSYMDLNNSFMIPVSLIGPSQPFLDDSKMEKYLSMQSEGTVQSIIRSLSSAELLLTIAAARWIAKSEVPQVNFNLAYKEYTDMMKQFNAEATTLSSTTSHIDNTVLAGIKVNQKILSSKIMRDCWVNLYKYGLLFDAVTSNNEVNANNNLNMYKSVVLDVSKTLQVDITLEELGKLIPDSDFYKKLTKL
ncbi:hypothetical protein FT663_00834 [Candidozyma haemuli var. vulneris]|uniref:Origin recognition complex subunit 4 n=1 Tax=Candidozyma haemuli TaxID=45357 RepID=A0A2V1AVQ4_9ASCO|nr:hypothetical protein CXQ85_004603 [[Candida] haemuloni]KAF3988389.1 hypothetical protein FT662_03422 [[Candida] haemuloni var. vulneris]KAF3994998.1 hypothetical protein FT663_00834 [[Candida] haemuloni var. vulneris]PVH21938.1 hypothetical protein CXQ85_004603 [[Candida] haemuloni]